MQAKFRNAMQWLRERNYTSIEVLVYSVTVMPLALLTLYFTLYDTHCNGYADKKSVEGMICKSLAAATTVAIYISFILTVCGISLVMLAHRSCRRRPAYYQRPAEL